MGQTHDANAGNGELAVSIIIPVYNKADFLERCVASIDRQTMDHRCFEALFIDDGSTDESLETLRSLAGEHGWMRVLSKENGGVCSARNAGIRAARGKYLFYLDPDDSLSPDVLEEVSLFFDAHYDEIDLATYKAVPFRGKKRLKPHFRYRTLVETGVYDLTEGENYLICQTTMNICVKNVFARNHTFDFLSSNGVIYHEDQQYITEILLDKMKIGYCAGPKYMWRKNESSSTATVLKPYYIFDNTLRMYEGLFGRFEGEVPPYLQALFVHDLGWKMPMNAALPLHLHGKQRQEAMGRLRALLDRVSDSILLTHPSVHFYHRFFFMSLKSGTSIEPVVEPSRLLLKRGDDVLYEGEGIEIYIMRTRIAAGRCFLIGSLKSPIFYFMDKDPRLIAFTSSEGPISKVEIPLGPSSMGRVGGKSTTARFFDFRYEFDIVPGSKIVFAVRMGGYEFPVHFTIRAQRSNFVRENGYSVITRRGVIEMRKEEGAFSMSARGLFEALMNDLGMISDHTARSVMVRRLISHENNRKRRKGGIWIYLDAKGRLDNAWLQFLHDAEKGDGIRRYYAANDVSITDFEGNDFAKVILFGSREHKLIHYCADMRICSDISRASISPWSERVRLRYADFDNAWLVYLQHGVLWAHMPWYYSYDRVLFDREVVSTVFEVDNLTMQYGFRRADLIESGMPRYDFMDSSSIPTKKILLCPSWRENLVGKLTKKGRKPLDDRFLNSDYYRNIQSFLENEKLVRLLEEHDYQLDFKLHPNFQCYARHFYSASDRVHMVEGEVDESSYAIVITDYSSYSFDFVYLQRALVYFIPDEEQFYGGVSHYNSLDIPLSDAFGANPHTPDEAVGAIEQLLENDGKPLPRYAERESGLFLHYDNNQRERLYEALSADFAASWEQAAVPQTT